MNRPPLFPTHKLDALATMSRASGLSFGKRSAHKLRTLALRACVCLAIALSTGCGNALNRATSNIAASAAAGAVDRVIAQPDSTVELLEAELRWMEDNLYRIDDQLETALLELESARRDNATLRTELANAKGENRHKVTHGSPTYYSEPSIMELSPPIVVEEPGTTVIRQAPPTSETIGTPAPRTAAPRSAIPAPAPANNGYDEETQDLAPDSNFNTIINYGDATPAPNSSRTDGDAIDGDLEPMPNPQLQQSPTEADIDPFTDDAEQPNSVKRIRLNPRLTGGFNFDDVPGHEGLMVVIEPQDEFGRYVRASGEVLIEVVDPAEQGVAGRVAKWKIDSLDARKHLRQSAIGKGVHLQLPWPAGPPKNRNLRLSVSYQLANGKTLAANKNILIDLPTSTLIEKAVAAERRWSPDRPTTTLGSPLGHPEETVRREPSDWLPGR